MLDGNGYYLGTSGDQLPPEARLIAVADVYAALAADRPYRKGMDQSELIDTMHGMVKSSHLDGKYVDVLLELLPGYRSAGAAG
ncbi:HD-GYP domain-containing protein [Desulfoscipio gibsoniae]|uniref:HD-GYP domain-containing protein n=1 Tax=Desulfoscipio gibsoniae TaxID=102134 RepID=UPI00307F803B